MEEQQLVEQLGNLAKKLVDARSKSEIDEHVKYVLGAIVHRHTVNTCGQSLDSHLYVNVTIDDKTFELSGENDHYSGVQHEPSYNGRIFGSEELVHLTREPVVIQLAYLYNIKGKKIMKIHAEFCEEHGDWENGNDVFWKVEFDFP